MMMSRRAPMFYMFLILVLLGAGLFVFVRPAPLHGAVIEPPKPMPDFTLLSSAGPVTLSEFRGKLVVLFFGYTSCPDVCPLTLANLREAFNRLGGKSSGVQVIFISVDPGRDTLEKLSGYTAAFHPDFLGLTGTREEIDIVTRGFGIYYSLGAADSSGYYPVEHTASTLVLDREGRMVLSWPNGTPPADMADDLGNLLR